MKLSNARVEHVEIHNITIANGCCFVRANFISDTLKNLHVRTKKTCMYTGWGSIQNLMYNSIVITVTIQYSHSKSTD